MVNKLDAGVILDIQGDKNGSKQKENYDQEHLAYEKSYRRKKILLQQPRLDKNLTTT